MEHLTNKSPEDDATQKYNTSIYRLEESIQKARQTNDKLSRQLSFLRNRTNNVARKFGFATFEDFEEAVLDEPEAWKMKTIRATYTQAVMANKTREQPRIHSPYQTSVSKRVMDELEPLKCQVHSLQLPIGKACSRSEIEVNIRSPLATLKSVGNSSPTEVSKLRAEVDILSRKYDALVAAKESAEERYKEDYRKWKYFKSWIFNKSKHAKALRAQLANGNFGDEFADDYDQDCQLAADQMDQRSESSRPKPDKDISSQSQSLRHQATAQGKMEFAKGKSTHSFQAEARSHLSESSRSDSSPLPCRSPDVPYSGPRRVSRFAEGIKKEAPVSPKSPSKCLKRKGGHASRAIAGEAINALYAIDTSRNDGLAFQYDEVVRNRQHRQRLDAGDCDCCKEYYEAVKVLPDRLPPPAWDCSPRVDDAGDENSCSSDPRDEVVFHKKQISRHRHQWSPAKTPPDYWNIGFPTTQEVADINRKAAEMHAAKRRRIEKEANMAGGRYIRRDKKREE